jgi:uncharacterized membrane protein HdeD (DUF308 family)
VKRDARRRRKIADVSTAAAASPRTTTDDRPGRWWWVPLVAGVLGVIVGIVALAYPGPTLLAVGIIFGAYLAAWGTMLIVHAAADGGAPVFVRVLSVIVGALGLLAGLILLVRPGESVLTAALVLGFWWVVSGSMQLARGVTEPEGRVWNILIGLLGVVAGIIILAQPGIGVITLVYIVGIGLIFQGILEIAAAMSIRNLRKEGLA